MANAMLKQLAVKKKTGAMDTLKKTGTGALGSKPMTGGATLNTANRAVTPMAGQKSLTGGNTLNTNANRAMPVNRANIKKAGMVNKPVNSPLANQMRKVASKMTPANASAFKKAAQKPVKTQTKVNGATVAKLKSGGLGDLGTPKLTTNSGKMQKTTTKIGLSTGNNRVKASGGRSAARVTNAPTIENRNGTGNLKLTSAKGQDKLKKAADSGEKLVYNPKSGTVSPKTKGNKYSKDPYIRNAQKQMKENYKVYNTQVKKAESQKNYANRNTNSTYNALNKSAYSSYMNNLKNRKQLAQNSGMTGGAAERLKVGAETNLNKNYATSEGMRISALGANKQAFDQKKANALASYQSKNNTAFANARSESLKAKKEAEAVKREDAQRDLDVYGKTVTGFDTQKKVDAEIARLKKSKDPNKDNKIRMLKAQGAANRAAEKQLKEQAKQTGVSVSRKEAVKEAGGKKTLAKREKKKEKAKKEKAKKAKKKKVKASTAKKKYKNGLM